MHWARYAAVSKTLGTRVYGAQEPCRCARQGTSGRMACAASRARRARLSPFAFCLLELITQGLQQLRPACMHRDRRQRGRSRAGGQVRFASSGPTQTNALYGGRITGCGSVQTRPRRIRPRSETLIQQTCLLSILQDNSADQILACGAPHQTTQSSIPFPPTRHMRTKLAIPRFDDPDADPKSLPWYSAGR